MMLTGTCYLSKGNKDHDKSEGGEVQVTSGKLELPRQVPELGC